MGTATWRVLSKPRSPFRGHRRARGALFSPLSADQCSPSALASRCRPSRLTDGGVRPGLSFSLQRCCRAGGPRPQTQTLEATLALEARPSEELPSSLCGHHCKSSQAPCWQCRRNHGDRLGRRPESARLSPVGTEGPGGHTAPHPGWRGQRGRGPPRGEAGRVCSPPPWKRRGRAGGTVPHPERNRRGGQGAQPCQVASICPGPTGMHLRLMESNNASTGDSHWLLRAFNPASLSSQGFMR